MIACIGLPEEDSAKKCEMEELSTRDTCSRYMKCRSLESTAECGMRLKRVEEMWMGIIKGLYDDLREHFPAEYSRSSLPKKIEDLESLVSNFTLDDTKYSEYGTLEVLVDDLMNEFEEKFKEIELFRKELSSKRTELRSLVSFCEGDFSTVCLNALIPREEVHEFIMPVYVLVYNDDVGRLKSFLSSEDIMSSSFVLETIASDKKRGIYKFYIVKSKECAVINGLREMNITIKSFVSDSVYSESLSKMSEVREFISKSPSILMEFIHSMIDLYCILKTAEIYFECIMAYGPAGNYVIRWCKTNKSKTLVRYVAKVARCLGSSSCMDACKRDKNIEDVAEIAGVAVGTVDPGKLFCDEDQ